MFVIKKRSHGCYRRVQCWRLVSNGYVCCCFPCLPLCKILIFTLGEGDVSGGDKSKKGVKRKKTLEESGETAKRRSARVRNTKCKKEEKVDFQGLLVKFLPSRYCTLVFFSEVTCRLLSFSSSSIFILLAPLPLGTLLVSLDLCLDTECRLH